VDRLSEKKQLFSHDDISPSHYQALVLLPHPPFLKRSDGAHCILESYRNGQHGCLGMDLVVLYNGIDITVDLEVLRFFGR
jgi:hypothetical protein